MLETIDINLKGIRIIDIIFSNNQIISKDYESDHKAKAMSFGINNHGNLIIEASQV